MRSRTVFTTLLFLTLFSTQAFAEPPKVFLNKVDITGVVDQVFEDATVRIDSKGDIYIDAPQYQVEVRDAAGQVKESGGGITKTYFLVVTNSAPGKVPHEIDIYINGVMLKTFNPKEAQLVVELNKNLSPGINTVTLISRPQAGGEAFANAGGTIDVLVGEGNSTDNQLTIEKRFVNFNVKSSDTASKTENFTFTAD